jgi:hypothetical protein
VEGERMRTPILCAVVGGVVVAAFVPRGDGGENRGEEPHGYISYPNRSMGIGEKVRRARMWRVLVVGTLFAAGCSTQPTDRPVDTARNDSPDPPIGHVLSRVDKDIRPAFRIEPTKPFRIEFGRGSGWHGLDTIKVDQDGRVVLHRENHQRQGDTIIQSWEKATLQLPPRSLTKVLEAVEANRLMELHKGYHANVADGTQWVLWIKQGNQEKSVYFNNHFPEQIVRFAERLDGILSECGVDKLDWQVVPAVETRRNERELWDSIK